MRPARQLEHRAVGEHDRQRLDPVARAAVLEGGRAGRVRGDDAAGARAGERGCRRKPRAGAGQPFLHRRDRDAGFDGDAPRLDVDDARHLRRREDDFTHRRRAAGEG